MYNKLFTKILDSTIWLQPDATRLVWITFLAVMDEDGFVALSSVGNVAARARVSIDDSEVAIKALEGPDNTDPTQEYEGRRIERVPYGWMVLNAGKYRDIIKRETAREQTRIRVARHRERHKSNADVTHANEKLTPSVAVAVSVSGKERAERSRGSRLPSDWQPPEALKAWASKERHDLNLEKTMEKFRDYWIAKPGKAGTKLDWNATFRNWVREEKQGNGQSPVLQAEVKKCRYCTALAIASVGGIDHCRKHSGEAYDRKPA